MDRVLRHTHRHVHTGTTHMHSCLHPHIHTQTHSMHTNPCSHTHIHWPPHHCTNTLAHTHAHAQTLACTHWHSPCTYAHILTLTGTQIHTLFGHTVWLHLISREKPFLPSLALVTRGLQHLLPGQREVPQPPWAVSHGHHPQELSQLPVILPGCLHPAGPRMNLSPHSGVRVKEEADLSIEVNCQDPCLLQLLHADSTTCPAASGDLPPVESLAEIRLDRTSAPPAIHFSFSVPLFLPGPASPLHPALPPGALEWGQLATSQKPKEVPVPTSVLADPLPYLGCSTPSPLHRLALMSHHSRPAAGPPKEAHRPVLHVEILSPGSQNLPSAQVSQAHPCSWNVSFQPLAG